MTKIKLVNGTILKASEVKIENSVLKISTTENTVEELAALFSNKENTSLITLMTESEKESGYKIGFTSFAGITYDADGVKTVELFQPVDITEARLSNAEGVANQAIATANSFNDRMVSVEEGQEIQDGAISDLGMAVSEIVTGGEA